MVFNLFERKSEHHKRYKELFRSWERYLLSHPKDVAVMSQTAVRLAIVTFDPVADKYGIPNVYDPDALVERIQPHDLTAVSEKCFAEADRYRESGSDRFYQGGILAGLYFGVAGLIADKERSAKSLWRDVEKAMSSSTQLAARSTAHHIQDHHRANKTAPQEQRAKPLHAKTVESLKKTGMSEERYRAIDGRRNEELGGLDEQLRSLFLEQQNLFAEVEKATESKSAAEIYGASISIMNLFERTMARTGPLIRTPEPEVVSAGMSKFIDRLYGADGEILNRMEVLSSALCARKQSETTLLGAKVTRVVVLGRFLSVRLGSLASLCAHESEWLSKTLLSDLEQLASAELAER